MNKIVKQFEYLLHSVKKPLKTELKYENKFQLLIAVMLSAQCRDIHVNKVTSKLFKKIKHPKDILDIGQEKLTEYINSINYYKNKAKYIYNACCIILKKGKFPSDLTSLPGVGRKSANVVLNNLIRAPLCPVDTHVARVSKRIGWTKNIKPEKIEKDIYELIYPLIDIKHHYKIHNLLVLHGRYICKSLYPKCQECLMPFCLFRKAKPSKQKEQQ